jgi:hypothetical protein
MATSPYHNVDPRRFAEEDFQREVIATLDRGDTTRPAQSRFSGGWKEARLIVDRNRLFKELTDRS